MDFRIKCSLQHLFSSLPKGEYLNYLFQRYISKAFPISNEKFLFKIDEAETHRQNFLKYNSLDSVGNEYYEFGAGWNLIAPLWMTRYGFKVSCIDIIPLITPRLIFETVTKFGENNYRFSFEIDTTKISSRNSLKQKLQQDFGLEYTAPMDARETNFESEKFDFMSSSVTLEHIPEKDLQAIINECFRILKPGGILSVAVDYQDHWSYFDKGISIYNFLKYSDKDWPKYNPTISYQNRLRHSDYVGFFTKAGFEIVVDSPDYPSDIEREALKGVGISDTFKRYSQSDLEIKSADFVLRKANQKTN